MGTTSGSDTTRRTEERTNGRDVCRVVRAAGGGEVVYWCGPLWLWEELAPWRGEGGWVGGAEILAKVVY